MKTLILVSILVFSNSVFAKSKGIENLSKATEGIYRGARPLDLSEMQELKALGMKSILNLQGGDTKSKMWKYISWHEPGENPE